MTSSFAMVRNSSGVARHAHGPVLVLGALLALVPACQSGEAPPERRGAPETSTQPQSPRIATGRVGDGLALRDNRVEAFAGRTLFVPIGPEAEDGTVALSTPPDWKPSGVPEIALVTDEPLTATMWRIRGKATPELPGLVPWSGGVREWSAQPAPKADAKADPGDIILWFLAIEMPDRPVGRWLRVGGRKLPLEWVPTPASPRTKPMDVQTLDRPDRERITRFVDRFGAELSDPFRGWRFRVLSDRMAIEAKARNTDPILEALGVQMTDRARASIERIRAIDATLADRIHGALTAVIDSPDRELLPAWPPDPSPALELFASVLREDRSEADIRADAQAFLFTAPEGIAWIVDEAGPDGPSTAPTCRVGIAERWGFPATASLSPLGMNAGNAVPLKPFGSAVLSVDPGYPGPIQTATLTARAGAWMTDMRVLAGTVGAKPPGVTLGPLLPEWTQSTWLRGVHPQIPTDAITVAMLQRQFDATGVPVGWELIIEAQRSSSEPGDAVTIWIGPMGDTVAAIRVSPEGEAAVIVGDMTGENLNVSINAEPSRWIAQLTIPPELIATSRIRIGVERIDARGLRSSWPRPMLPGQPEPGRIAIDLTSW